MIYLQSKNMMTTLGVLFCFFHMTILCGQLPSQTILSDRAAETMVGTIINKAKELDLKVTIAITDNGGMLKCLYRMNGALTATVEVAEKKARSSAMIGRSTREIGQMELIQNSFPALSSLSFVIPLAGGFPITTNSGELIGGIGVSGATPEEDEVLAQAGLQAVTSQLISPDCGNTTSTSSDSSKNQLKSR